MVCFVVIYILKDNNIASIASDVFSRNKIAVIKTDTLYGIVASIHSKIAINRIYKIKNRNKSKPLIVLISNINQLNIFNIDKKFIDKSNQYWPGPNTLLMPVGSSDLSYLAKNKKIAFRLPKDEFLQDFLKVSGPVVAPSANPEAMTPAKNIKVARSYFGNKVDYYIDSGPCTNIFPSTIIDISNNKVLR